MSNPLTLKIAVGTLALGGVSGGGYLIHSHVSNKTLNKDILIKNSKKILTKGDARWNVAFNRYQSKSKTDSQYKVSPVLTSHSELESWCLKEENSSYEESLYFKIEKLCTAPSISDYLGTINKTLLSSFSTKADTHKTYSTDTTLIIPQSEIGIEQASTTEEKLKQWCTSSVNSEYKNENDVLYKRIKQWCLND